MSRRALCLAFALQLLVMTPVLHAEYWTVSQDLSADFQQLSDAVAWAAEGDTIYGHDGTHDAVEIVGKSLYVASHHDSSAVVEGILILDLQAEQCVSLSGLEVTQRPTVGDAALRIVDCAGSVRLQDCLVHAVYMYSWYQSGIAVSIESSSNVAANGCEFLGSAYHHDEPRAAFIADASSISLSDCFVEGGMGWGYEDGWPGMDLGDCLLFLTATVVRGGSGWWGLSCDQPGDGGVGLIATGLTTVFLLDSAPEGGYPGFTWDIFCEDGLSGEPGPAVDLGPDVDLQRVPGVARGWTVDNVVEKEARLEIRYRGEPGDRVYAMRSIGGAFEVHPDLGGVLLVARPHTQSPCLGTAVDGELVVEVPISELDLPGHEDSFLLQAFAITSEGRFRWAGPASLAVIGTEVFDPYRSPVHVDGDAPPGGDGTSWSRAFDDLQAAIEWTQWTYENVLPEVREIWIAEGEYVAPLAGAEGEDGFEIVFPTSLYGGFAGVETSVEERDIEAHPTILTGDQLGDDGPDFQNYDDNARIVLRIDADDEDIVLDGLVIRGGNGQAGGKASGIRGEEVGRLVIRNCELVANRGYLGGAANFTKPISTFLFDEVDVVDTVFRGNRSFSAGGGILSDLWKISLINCRFVDNQSSHGKGGGAYVRGEKDGPPMVIGCEFSRNVAKQGGGLYLRSHGPLPVVSGCTFRDNEASNGAGGLQVGNDTAFLRNSILWNNSTAGVVTEASQVEVNTGDTLAPHYCCIDGWTGTWGGEGNHGLDPLFLNGGHLGPGSPCVDAADNTAVPADTSDLDGDGDTLEPLPFDLDGNPRFVDDSAVPDTGIGRPPIVDMGAFERQGP